MNLMYRSPIEDRRATALSGGERYAILLTVLANPTIACQLIASANGYAVGLQKGSLPVSMSSGFPSFSL